MITLDCDVEFMLVLDDWIVSLINEGRRDSDSVAEGSGAECFC